MELSPVLLVTGPSFRDIHGCQIQHFQKAVIRRKNIYKLQISHGITFDEEGYEDVADKYAADKLIPPEKYQMFIQADRFDVDSISKFAKLIERDPGIILGRLKNDGKVSYDNWQLTTAFTHQYKIKYS